MSNQTEGDSKKELIVKLRRLTYGKIDAAAALKKVTSELKSFEYEVMDFMVDFGFQNFKTKADEYGPDRTFYLKQQGWAEYDKENMKAVIEAITECGWKDILALAFNTNTLSSRMREHIEELEIDIGEVTDADLPPSFFDKEGNKIIGFRIVNSIGSITK